MLKGEPLVRPAAGLAKQLHGGEVQTECEPLTQVDACLAELFCGGEAQTPELKLCPATGNVAA